MELSTPALLFPAISLLLLAYTNRFLGIASVIRGLHGKINDTNKDIISRQIVSLKKRVKLVIWMQILGVLSITFCVIAMFLLFFKLVLSGQVVFCISLIFMLMSLALSLYELRVSGHALTIELEDMDQ